MKWNGVWEVGSCTFGSPPWQLPVLVPWPAKLQPQPAGPARAALRLRPPREGEEAVCGPRLVNDGGIERTGSEPGVTHAIEGSGSHQLACQFCGGVRLKFCSGWLVFGIACQHVWTVWTSVFETVWVTLDQAPQDLCCRKVTRYTSNRPTGRVPVLGLFGATLVGRACGRGDR